MPQEEERPECHLAQRQEEEGPRAPPLAKVVSAQSPAAAEPLDSLEVEAPRLAVECQEPGRRGVGASELRWEGVGQNQTALQMEGAVKAGGP